MAASVWPVASSESRADIVVSSRSKSNTSKFPSIRGANADRWIRYEGREHFDDAIRAGRGVLFATAHLRVVHLNGVKNAEFAISRRRLRMRRLWPIGF